MLHLGKPGAAFIWHKMNSLYENICSFENLLLAFRKAGKGKRGRAEVAGFEHNLETELIGLQQDLVLEKYQPGNYHSFFIHDPKKRLISAAPFRDRVVHHALCNFIEPIFERVFITDSFANRKLKGTHRALDRAQQFSRNFRYVLPCDIKQFFPSIDHRLLWQILAKKIQCPRTQVLMTKILHSGEGVLDNVYDMHYFPGDDLLATFRPRGLPIGNLTSQFWANVYLNPIDQFIKRELRCKGYVRYVDDMLLFSSNKEELWRWKQALENRLAQFRLIIHPGACLRPVTEGFPFLGFSISPERRKLKRRKGVQFQKKLSKLSVAYSDFEIDLPDVGCRINGWVNHVRFANTIGLRRSVLGRVSFRRNHVTNTVKTNQG